MKKIFIVAAAFIFAGCGVQNNNFDATGTFEATEVIVSAEAAGRIMTLNIDEGSVITAGQVLGTIDSLQLYLQKMMLVKNRSSVESNRPSVATQIAATKNQIDKQIVERARVEKLLASSAATTKQLDDINSAIEVLQSQLAAQLSTLENNVSSIDAQSSAIDIQIAQIADKLAKCTITSPMSGVVLAKYAQAGELSTIGKPLFKVADIEHLFLRAYVTSGQLSQIKLGQKVKVMADFGGKKQIQYGGVIDWISDKSEFTPKTIQTKDDRENLVYAVKIAVVNDGVIKIGMYGEVIF